MSAGNAVAARRSRLIVVGACALLALVLGAAQAYVISASIPWPAPWMCIAGTVALFAVLAFAAFVAFRLLSDALPRWLFWPLLIVPVVAMACWTSTFTLPVLQAAAVDDGRRPIAAVQMREWNLRTSAFFLHPHYEDKRPVEEIAVAVPGGATALNLIASKPYKSVLRPDGSVLGDGVEILVTVYAQGRLSRAFPRFLLDPTYVAGHGWKRVTVPLSSGDDEVRILVTKGGNRSGTSYDLTIAAMSFSVPKHSFSEFGRYTLVLTLGALLLCMLSFALARLPAGQALLQSPELQRATLDLAKMAVLAIMAICTALLLYECARIFIWRHDDIYNLHFGNYYGKFTDDGRWLTLILFPVAKLIPGNVALIAGLAMFGYFIYVVSDDVSRDRIFSVIVALLCLQSIPLYQQGMWPGCSLPAYVLLALAALFHRRMPIPLFFAVFGILFFGTITQYYYLLPLLYLGYMGRRGRLDVRSIAFVLGCWAAGFVIGFAAAFALKTLFASASVAEIASWRQPKYVASAADLVANVKSRLHYLWSNLGAVLQSPAVAAFLLTALAVRIERRSLPYMATAGIVCAAIVLAHYVVTVPIGIMIEWRTVIATFVGVLAFIFVFPQLALERKTVVAICALGVFLQYWIINWREMSWFRIVTTTYYGELLRAAPLPPPYYRGLILEGLGIRELENKIEQAEDIRPYYSEPLSVLSMREMGGDLRWGAAAVAAGFRHLAFCPSAEDTVCATELRDFEGVSCSGQARMYCVRGTTRGNHLVIKPNTEVLR